MTRGFVRLLEFEKQCKSMGLNEDNIREIENIILDNPTVGDVMPGTGGVRKFRYALPNTGKSGGARVIYIDFIRYEKTYLITAYNKGVTDNLSKAEQNELKKFVKILETEAGKGG